MRDLMQLVEDLDAQRDDGECDQATTARPNVRLVDTAAPRHVQDAGRRGSKGHRIGAWHQHAKAGDGVVREARRMRKEGRTYQEIAEALDYPWLTIRDWVTYRTRADA